MGTLPNLRDATTTNNPNLLNAAATPSRLRRTGARPVSRRSLSSNLVVTAVLGNVIKVRLIEERQAHLPDDIAYCSSVWWSEDVIDVRCQRRHGYRLKPTPSTYGGRLSRIGGAQCLGAPTSEQFRGATDGSRPRTHGRNISDRSFCRL